MPGRSAAASADKEVPPWKRIPSPRASATVAQTGRRTAMMRPPCSRAIRSSSPYSSPRSLLLSSLRRSPFSRPGRSPSGACISSPLCSRSSSRRQPAISSNLQRSRSSARRPPAISSSLHIPSRYTARCSPLSPRPCRSKRLPPGTGCAPSKGAQSDENRGFRLVPACGPAADGGPPCPR